MPSVNCDRSSKLHKFLNNFWTPSQTLRIHAIDICKSSFWVLQWHIHHFHQYKPYLLSLLLMKLINFLGHFRHKAVVERISELHSILLSLVIACTKKILLLILRFNSCNINNFTNLPILWLGLFSLISAFRGLHSYTL